MSTGIDAHLERWYVTVLVAGQELFHGRIPGKYSALRSLLNRLVGCQIGVAYEAGACGFGLHDRFQADGFTCSRLTLSLLTKALSETAKRPGPSVATPFPSTLPNAP